MQGTVISPTVKPTANMPALMNLTFYSTHMDTFNVNNIQLASQLDLVSRKKSSIAALKNPHLDLNLCIKFLRSKDPTLRKISSITAQDTCSRPNDRI